MNIGLGIGIPFTRSSLWSNIFTPTALFMDGSTEGVWYDPSDIKLNWRRNLLTYSEQFDNGAWPQNNITISANAAVSPDGTTTADLIYPTTTGGDRRLLRQTDGALTNGLVYTQSIYVKSSGFQWVRLNAVDATSGSDDVWFDVVNGVVGTVGSDAVATQITSAGNGWFRISVTGTAGLNDYFLLALADANNSTSATANGTSGIYIWGAQLEVGSTSTEYQRITDGISDYLTYQPLPVLYQDAAGTTPVTAVEQPVGLMLDKSKGLVLGPELVVNGTFNTDVSDWTRDISWVSSGVARVTTLAISGPYQMLTTVVGKRYTLKAQVLTSTTTARVRVTTDNGLVNVVAETADVSSGILTLSFVATSTTSTVYLRNSAAGTTDWDNISVRELPGNHAYQTVSTKRPVLSARVNLLTKTEDFSDAVWGKAGVTVTANAVVAPDGTLTADSIAGTASGYSQYLLLASPANAGISAAASITNTYSVYLKAGSISSVRFYIFNTTGGTNIFADFNLSAISATPGGTASTPSVTISDVGNGWRRCTVTGSLAGSTGQIANVVIYADNGNFYAWGVDARVSNTGVNLPAYQRVNTATDYDTQGFPLSVRFDGIDDAMQTNSIDFTATDKMTVFAGVRKLSDVVGADLDIIAELSTASEVSNGAFALIGSNGFGGSQKTTQFNSNGTALVAAESTSTNYAAPITYLLSGIGNISGDQAILRVNGAQAAISTADQGTGNYGNYPLYIGARAGTSLFFNGLLYQLIIAGGSVINIAEEDLDLVLNESGDSITAETTLPIGISTIEACERFVNRKTLAY